MFLGAVAWLGTYVNCGFDASVAGVCTYDTYPTSAAAFDGPRGVARASLRHLRADRRVSGLVRGDARAVVALSPRAAPRGDGATRAVRRARAAEEGAGVPVHVRGEGGAVRVRRAEEEVRMEVSMMRGRGARVRRLKYRATNFISADHMACSTSSSRRRARPIIIIEHHHYARRQIRRRPAAVVGVSARPRVCVCRARASTPRVLARAPEVASRVARPLASPRALSGMKRTYSRSDEESLSMPSHARADAIPLHDRPRPSSRALVGSSSSSPPRARAGRVRAPARRGDARDALRAVLVAPPRRAAAPVARPGGRSRPRGRCVVRGDPSVRRRRRRREHRFARARVSRRPGRGVPPAFALEPVGDKVTSDVPLASVAGAPARASPPPSSRRCAETARRIPAARARRTPAYVCGPPRASARSPSRRRRRSGRTWRRSSARRPPSRSDPPRVFRRRRARRATTGVPPRRRRRPTRKTPTVPPLPRGGSRPRAPRAFTSARSPARTRVFSRGSPRTRSAASTSRAWARAARTSPRCSLEPSARWTSAAGPRRSSPCPPARATRRRPSTTSAPPCTPRATSASARSSWRGG